MGRRLSLACCSLIIFSSLLVSLHAQASPAASVQRIDVHWNKKGGKCRAGRHGLRCNQCPKGYYSTDGTHCQRCSNFRTTRDCENGCTSPSECTELGCPVGTYKAPTSSECQPCPVGTYSEGGFPYPKECEPCPSGTTTPGRGSYSIDQCVHIVCPAGTAREPGGLDCLDCPKGSYSEGGADDCLQCPQGTTTLETGADVVELCVCQAGWEIAGARGSACTQCKAGSYKSEVGNSVCQQCPWPKTTLKPGSTSTDDCVCLANGGHGGSCLDCPENMVLLDDGTCGCAPGYGGPKCEECRPRFFSPGGRPGNTHPKCKPCGLHFTSPAGAISAEYCECEAGYGADLNSKDTRRCVPCALGTFNPGSGGYSGASVTVAAAVGRRKRKISSETLNIPQAKPCQRCNAAHPMGNFTTLQTGSTSAGECICMPGYGGSSCAACSAGTYSDGGKAAICQSCPFGGAGYTTIPETAAASVASCVCLAGYGVTEGGICRLCPANTYSEGGTRQECKPCPFGSTSSPGAQDLEDCVSVAQECPVGQIAPPDAVSREQCACYPGYGGGGSRDAPCHVCPVGTYSPGGDLEACKPCAFGYTSALGSSSPLDCFPVDQCPAGTELTNFVTATSTQQCKCKAGYGSPTGEGTCRVCPAGTFSPGGTMEDCKACPFGKTSKPGSSSAADCVAATQACPVGQVPTHNAVSQHQCGCLPGYGGGRLPSDACSICPAGTFAPGGNTQPCQPCAFGYTSAAGSTTEEDCYPSNACPAGTQAPAGTPISSVQECVCKAGFGSSDGKSTCSICPPNTFSEGGTRDECQPCPYGTVSDVGSTSVKECVASNQACPIGQYAPEGAVSRSQCICYPGFGGGDTPEQPCTVCPAGTYSRGETLDKCIPCEFGMTSPLASTSHKDCYPINQCPAGTRVPKSRNRPGYASSVEECKCKPGHGSATGQGACRLCPAGTFSTGGTMDDCEPCGFGYTSPAGAESKEQCSRLPHKCPAGQIAPPDAVSEAECACRPGWGGGASPRDPCHLCPVGTYSAGGTTEPCKPCGFGFSSPQGAIDSRACYPTNACPAGTELDRRITTHTTVEDCVCKPGYGSPTGSGICRLCPAGTYSYGGNMEDCQPCPFGYWSGEGTESPTGCKLSPDACPIGQFAPADAVSSKECRCYKGFGGGSKSSDPCTLCPAGTFSANKGTEKCVPCRFGYTSPEGAEDENECYPIDVCPAGTEVPKGIAGSSTHECKCKPGHGSSKGSGPCRLCPVGTYAEGGTYEDCKPCDWGFTSPAGAQSRYECQPVARKCPPGQIAPPSAVSVDQCVCMPGYGGGRTNEDACTLCPAGTFAPGGSTQHCIPCGFGFTSPEGSTSAEYCVPVNACPAGTDYRDSNVERAFSTNDCVCKPGYGSTTGTGMCRLCPAGTFSSGGSMEDCRTCPFGYTSREGARDATECERVEQACPIGQVAPSDAVSVQQCHCYRGFGGGASPSDPCTICPRGTYSANRGTDKCLPCPAGFTSPEGSSSFNDCHPDDICPAGAGSPDGTIPTDAKDCKCRPGYGSANGAAPCHLCPIGTFSQGGSMEACRPCPFGTTSKPGAQYLDECVPVAQACPVGQVAPPNAVSKEECGCLPGFGGGDSPQDGCKVCPAGTWAPGGDTQRCRHCGFGYTGPEGATSRQQCFAVNACPAGTAYKDGADKATSVVDCVCKPGHGTAGSGTCRLCPAGTFSPGGSLDECTPCGFGLTSAEGSEHSSDCHAVAQVCPIGQWVGQQAVSEKECRCYKGFGGQDDPEQACVLCPAGTYSANSGTDRCVPCPAGFTSPAGAGSQEECYPLDVCPAGTALVRDSKGRFGGECKCKSGYGSVTGTAPCKLCPAGTYSRGGSMEDCIECPFGYTSKPGAESEHECVRASQVCPVGQIALPDAISKDQCGCLPGFGGGATPKDACKVCPVGTWSPGGSTQPCISCGFGYSSPEGSKSQEQCVPVNACPAGTEYRDGAVDRAFSISDCVCRPGFGSPTGSGICRLCPAGTFGPGGSHDDCYPCPFGTTSGEGHERSQDCRPVEQACPIGQFAPADAVSAQECRCYRGFGGGQHPTDPCTICPAGTYSPNKGTSKCVPCRPGFTSTDGADECFPEDESPPGTAFYTTKKGREYKCKPGYGSATGSAPCRLCPIGTYAEGGTMEDCKPCSFGHTSAAGSDSKELCLPLSQPCPVGQIAPPDAVSPRQCGCAPGHGAGATPESACTVCPAGTYSPGGRTQPCLPCGWAYTSPEGAWSESHCVEINACPVGTQYRKTGGKPLSLNDCVCKPGYGASTESGGACRLCPRGSYSSGGSLDDCLPCPNGKTSDGGAVSWKDCYHEYQFERPQQDEESDGSIVLQPPVRYAPAGTSDPEQLQLMSQGGSRKRPTTPGKAAAAAASAKQTPGAGTQGLADSQDKPSAPAAGSQQDQEEQHVTVQTMSALGNAKKPKAAPNSPAAGQQPTASSQPQVKPSSPGIGSQQVPASVVGTSGNSTSGASKATTGDEVATQAQASLQWVDPDSSGMAASPEQQKPSGVPASADNQGKAAAGPAQPPRSAQADARVSQGAQHFATPQGMQQSNQPVVLGVRERVGRLHQQQV